MLEISTIYLAGRVLPQRQRRVFDDMYYDPTNIIQDRMNNMQKQQLYMDKIQGQVYIIRKFTDMGGQQVINKQLVDQQLLDWIIGGSYGVPPATITDIVCSCGF